MKTTLKRVSKSSLSIILAIMMIFSTMLVGTLAVDAADYNFVGGNTIYFKPTSDWVNGSGGLAAYFFNSDSSQSNQWVRLTTTDNTYYSATIPTTGSWKNVIFTRLNTTVSSSTNSGTGFPTSINQTGDLFGADGMNCYTLDSSTQWQSPGDSVNGTSCWSKYDDGGSSGGGDSEGTTLYVAGNFGHIVKSVTVWTGSADAEATLIATEYTYNGYTVYKAVNVSSGSYTHLNFNDDSSRWSKIINNTDSSNYNGQLYYCTDATQSNATWISTPQWDSTTTYTVTYGNGSNGTLTADVASGSEVEEGTFVTFTATPAIGYEVEGWYSDSSFSTKLTNSTDTTYTATINADTSVYVQFKAIDYTITYEKPANISTAPNAGTANYNEQVTISGYTVKTESDKDVSVTNGTFTMPAENVTVTPVVKAVTPAVTGFALIDNENSLINAKTYDASSYKFTKNESTGEYTVNVTYSEESKNWFKVIDSTGTIYGTNNSSSERIDDNTTESGAFTLYKKSDGTTGSTVNNESPYALYFDSNADKTTYTVHLKETTDGSLKIWVTTGSSGGGSDFALVKTSAQDNFSSLTVEGVFTTGANNTYTLTKTLSEGTYYYYIENGETTSPSVTYNNQDNADFFDGNTFTVNGNVTTTMYTYGSNFKTLNVTIDQAGEYTFTWSYTTGNNGTLTIEPGFDIATKVTVYAKDGTQGGTAAYGETSVRGGSTGEKSTGDADCLEYTALEGEVLTISTTVNSNYYLNGEGYYVAGFVVNGNTYHAVDKGKGVYETELTIDGSVSKIEVTPVYFSKAIEEAGDYITFYVDASELPADKWGSTLSVYSYYYDNTNTKNENTQTQDGAWPGQPMLKDASGSLWTKVSKYYYGASTEHQKDSTNVEYDISGIVLTNYQEDSVHGKVESSLTSSQTYDYNELVVAANQGYDTIRFEIKYRDSKIYNGSFYTNNNAPSTIDPDNALFANGWTDFTYYDKTIKTDILGNEAVEGKDTVYIVSVGNIKDTAKVGEFSTLWYVYAKDSNGNYNLVTSGHPSEFIKREGEGATQTDAYTAMNTAALIGSPTLITYEGESGDDRNRIDGRWYYTKAASTNVTINMGVQYKETADGAWNDGVNGTNGTATIDNETSKTFNEINIDAQLNAIPPRGYVFDSWVIDYTGEGVYTTMDLATASGLIKVQNNATIVARFAPIAEGNIVITHNAYPGSGLGYYYISATLYDKNGNPAQSFTNQASSVAFTGVNVQDYSEIVYTLKTRPGGINVFSKIYQRFNEEFFPIAGSDEVTFDGTYYTITRTIKVSELFTTDMQTQMINSINFYSEVKEVTADANLEYKYVDRFGNNKSYKATIRLTDDYIDANGFVLTFENKDENNWGDYIKGLIYSNAPAVDVNLQNFKWVISDQVITTVGTNATIKAVQTAKVYTVTIKDYDENDELIEVDTLADMPYNSLLSVDYCTDYDDIVEKTESNPAGLIFKPSGANGKTFLYWSVVNGDDVEITRYYSELFGLRILDNYTITAVYGEISEASKPYISNPTFTREQYTVGNTNYDYLYADFNVDYMSGLESLVKTSDTIRTGIILELDKTAITTDGNIGDINFESDTSENGLQRLIYDKDSSTYIPNGKYGTYTYTGENGDTSKRLVYNFELNNEDYTNKNRSRYYIRFANTANNTQYVMKAYYYTIDENGNLEFSDHVFFSYYAIGHSNANIIM